MYKSINYIAKTLLSGNIKCFASLIDLLNKIGSKHISLKAKRKRFLELKFSEETTFVYPVGKYFTYPSFEIYFSTVTIHPSSQVLTFFLFPDLFTVESYTSEGKKILEIIERIRNKYSNYLRKEIKIDKLYENIDTLQKSPPYLIIISLYGCIPHYISQTLRLRVLPVKFEISITRYEKNEYEHWIYLSEDKRYLFYELLMNKNCILGIEIDVRTKEHEIIEFERDYLRELDIDKEDVYVFVELAFSGFSKSILKKYSYIREVRELEKCIDNAIEVIKYTCISLIMLKNFLDELLRKSEEFTDLICSTII